MGAPRQARLTGTADAIVAGMPPELILIAAIVAVPIGALVFIALNRKKRRR